MLSCGSNGKVYRTIDVQVGFNRNTKEVGTQYASGTRSGVYLAACEQRQRLIRDVFNSFLRMRNE